MHEGIHKLLHPLPETSRAVLAGKVPPCSGNAHGRWGARQAQSIVPSQNLDAVEYRIRYESNTSPCSACCSQRAVPFAGGSPALGDFIANPRPGLEDGPGE